MFARLLLIYHESECWNVKQQYVKWHFVKMLSVPILFGDKTSNSSYFYRWLAKLHYLATIIKSVSIGLNLAKLWQNILTMAGNISNETFFAVSWIQIQFKKKEFLTIFWNVFIGASGLRKWDGAVPEFWELGSML